MKEKKYDSGLYCDDGLYVVRFVLPVHWGYGVVMIRKRKMKAPRDWICVNMLRHTKPDSHGDARKNESKTKARKKVDVKKEGW